MSKKNNNNGRDIYQKIKDILMEQDIEEIPVPEFFKLVENMKICEDEIVDVIAKDLKKLNLPPVTIDRICNDLAWKIRFRRSDARVIEKKLRKDGFLSRHRFSYLVINKDS